MKMQKYVTFVKKNLKTNMWQIKNFVKLDIIVIMHCYYVGAAHSICNLKYSAPKKILKIFIMDLS